MNLGLITKTAHEACSSIGDLDNHLQCYSTVAKKLSSFSSAPTPAKIAFPPGNYTVLLQSSTNGKFQGSCIASVTSKNVVSPLYMGEHTTCLLFDATDEFTFSVQPQGSLQRCEVAFTIGQMMESGSPFTSGTIGIAGKIGCVQFEFIRTPNHVLNTLGTIIFKIVIAVDSRFGDDASCTLPSPLSPGTCSSMGFCSMAGAQDTCQELSKMPNYKTWFAQNFGSGGVNACASKYVALCGKCSDCQ